MFLGTQAQSVHSIFIYEIPYSCEDTGRLSLQFLLAKLLRMPDSCYWRGTDDPFCIA